MNAPKRQNPSQRASRPISYRRRRRGAYWRVGLISAASTVLVIAVALLIVGNVLLKNVEPNDAASEGDFAEQSAVTYPRPPSVQAYASLPSDLPSYASVLLQNGCSAVSLSLNTADGALLYRSSAAISMGIQPADTSLASLTSAIAAADGAGLRVSAVFYLTAFSEENDLLRSVALSQSASLIAEAIREGVDDVTLVAENMTREQLGEFLSLLSDIRALAPNGVLGAAVPSSLLSAENTDALLNELHSAVNYLAMPLSPSEGQSASVLADERLNDAQLRYYLLYYRMRLLLPQIEDPDEQARLLTVIANNAFDDYQFLAE